MRKSQPSLSEMFNIDSIRVTSFMHIMICIYTGIYIYIYDNMMMQQIHVKNDDLQLYKNIKQCITHVTPQDCDKPE